METNSKFLFRKAKVLDKKVITKAIFLMNNLKNEIINNLDVPLRDFDMILLF